METYLDLTKGMHTDYDPINQPTGTYRSLRNAIRQQSGAIENELGNTLVQSIGTIDARVVGLYVLDNDIVIFTVDSNGVSEIGVLDSNDLYQIITQDSSLGFSYTNNVKAEGKRNFKGERVIYFTDKGLSMRVLNLDRVPTVDFDDNTKLVLTASMPQVNLVGVVDGGSIPTGVYQFGIRLLTKSTNSTSISLLTNPIPVVDDAELDRDKYDGAPPQTESSKAISLSITNIDTDYEFLEVIAITYIGTANVAQANVVSRTPIQGRSSIDFTYSSLSQIREAVDITGLVTDASNYDSAEFIIQKDGVLIFGGMTAVVSDYNFQPSANKVSIKYVIKESLWNESISIVEGVDVGTVYPVGNDYKNAVTSTNFRSFQRDEVYSFAVTPIFKNWSMGNAYHIPGASTETAVADTNTKLLGTYVSSELYPLGKGYPVGAVRHHRMPSLIQEPHIISVNDQSCVIRQLGISVDLTAMIADIPDNVKRNIIGYVVTKQKRDENNKSILTQGIAAGHVLTSGSPYSPQPFSGHNNMYSTGTVNDSSMVAFYSPETTITKESMKSATILRPVLQIKGVSTIVRDNRAGDNKYAHVFLNYHTATKSTAITSAVRGIDTSYTRYIDAGAELTAIEAGKNLPTVPITGLNKSINTWRNNGYLFFKLSNGSLPVEELFNGGKGDVFYEQREGATDRLYLNGLEKSIGGTGITQRYLYNLSKALPRQYGSVFEAKYHYVNHLMLSDTPSSVIECYNGDVYITKFAVLTSMNPNAGVEQSFDLKALNYFWVESGINTSYRHFKAPIGKEGQADFVAGTLPYYPKSKVLSTTNIAEPGIFNYSTSLGHPTGYNKQYSFENTIRTYFPVSIEIESVTDFPNRLVYTDQSIEGEQLDAFRILLANNFHDIPKERGRITNIFKLGNTLYVHTERSLWKTFFNEQVTQVTSAGEAYLGNGGIFNRPAVEITTVKGGYGGTTSYNSSCTTPFGHFFTDTNQKKLFMFTDQLVEIGEQGMGNYFRENLESIPDTPAAGSGYTSVYDYEEKRWILTKIGEWTISYSSELKSWSSWHDYIPYTYVSSGNKLYSVNKNELYIHNQGTRGVFYGDLPASMSLSIVVNDAANETKTFDNLVIYNTSEKNGREQHYDTFSTLQCHNNRQNTGKCRVIVPRSFEEDFQQLGTFEVFAKLKSNEFRIAIPSDLVLDANGDIFDTDNLGLVRDYNHRMSGKYTIVDLGYNNLRDNRFVLHNLGRLFRQRTR